MHLKMLNVFYRSEGIADTVIRHRNNELEFAIAHCDANTEHSGYALEPGAMARQDLLRFSNVWELQAHGVLRSTGES